MFVLNERSVLEQLGGQEKGVAGVRMSRVELEGGEGRAREGE